MKVNNPDLVLVRGINKEHFINNFKEFCIGFGGAPQAIPKEDAYYVGLYLADTNSEITHIGIVDRIERYKDGGVEFFLKAIIKLNKPIKPGHAIRKHENWTLSQFGLNQTQMENIRRQLNTLSQTLNNSGGLTGTAV